MRYQFLEKYEKALYYQEFIANYSFFFLTLKGMRVKLHLFLYALLVSTFSLFSYEFRGTHFFASYKECNTQALEDISKLKDVLKEAVEKSGATILKYDFFDFSDDSTTGTFILSESHASIHTYPEHKACFVDLFTCGDHCHWEPFHAVLKAYLQPEVIDDKVKTRS